MDESLGVPEPMQPSWVIDPRPFDRAGELLLAAVTAVLAEKERVRLAIPGGSALEAVCMARQRLKEQWRRVVLTWVDERCVGVEDEASNRGEAARRGLVAFGNGREVGVAPALVVPLFEDGESPAGAVRRVRSVWKSELAEALDIALLGMGPDGHIASLFPSSRSLPNEDWVAHVADSPKPPADRITLTRAALATARHLILVAAGEEKRQALDRLMAGDPALPACGLEGLVVVTDVALAKRT